jgi:hypothetical protein
VALSRTGRLPSLPGRAAADSVTDDVPAVIAAAFDEVERRDPRMAESDSARW